MMFVFIDPLLTMRNEKFYSSIPGYDKSQFKKSEFLRLSNNTEAYSSTSSLLHCQCRSIRKENKDYNAMKTYIYF